MGFSSYFDRFSPVSWFDGGLTVADDLIERVESNVTQKMERVQKAGGLLLAGASLAAAAAVATTFSGGVGSGYVERVATAPIPHVTAYAYEKSFIAEMPAHDYAGPGYWADAMASVQRMAVIDESELLDIDSFF